MSHEQTRRVLIVSNRLPVTVKLDRGQVAITQSAGGLATGLSGLHKEGGSLWIGWPGDVSRFDRNQQAETETNLSQMGAVPVYLSQAEINRYYEGFSNGVLWPLFHYLTDKVERDAWRNWKTYAAVNRRFAEITAEHYREGDLIWVHDYQLMLVPAMLRRMIPDALIGFFLHIPFPASDVFRILPWREEIAEGVLGSDLIGFHTHSYLKHFKRMLGEVLNLDSDGERVQHSDREVRLGVFPMGIDAERFTRLSEEPGLLEEVHAIRKECGERKLLLGVDRLDYTKGLGRRMLAIERLLEREPSLRNKIRFVQVVVPSRTKVGSYDTLRRQLDETVGRINGSYATVNAVPIHYLYRSVSEQQLAALYRAADVMIVTPLRDGMNLVAKEFIASRADEDGVLILSEFAGAAAELKEAVQVNPYDIERLASAIKKAMTMPAEERRARMWALRRRVQAFNSHRWAETFMGVLQSTKQWQLTKPEAASSEEEIAVILGRVHPGARLILLLDYDGTLVPFAGTPELAAPDEELKLLLKELTKRPNTEVHLLSGRTRETLDKWLGDLRIHLHAEHGYWSRAEASGAWNAISDVSPKWKEEILPLFERFREETPGALIEEKAAGLAWHFRLTDAELGDRQAKRLMQKLQVERERLPIEILPGSKVVEVRMKGVNKGVVATRVLADCDESCVVIAMGDDRTDEDLFAAMPKGGITVRIGQGPSLAEYRLSDTAVARLLLKRLLEVGAETEARTQSQLAKQKAQL